MRNVKLGFQAWWSGRDESRSPRQRQRGRGPVQLWVEELENRLAPAAPIYGFLAPTIMFNGVTEVPVPGKVVRIDAGTGHETTLWEGPSGTGDGPFNGVAEPSGTLAFNGIVGGKDAVYTLDPAASQPTPVLLDSNGYNGLAVSASGKLYLYSATGGWPPIVEGVE